MSSEETEISEILSYLAKTFGFLSRKPSHRRTTEETQLFFVLLGLFGWDQKRGQSFIISNDKSDAQVTVNRKDPDRNEWTTWDGSISQDVAKKWARLAQILAGIRADRVVLQVPRHSRRNDVFTQFTFIPTSVETDKIHFTFDGETQANTGTMRSISEPGKTLSIIDPAVLNHLASVFSEELKEDGSASIADLATQVLQLRIKALLNEVTNLQKKYGRGSNIGPEISSVDLTRDTGQLVSINNDKSISKISSGAPSGNLQRDVDAGLFLWRIVGFLETIPGSSRPETSALNPSVYTP